MAQFLVQGQAAPHDECILEVATGGHTLRSLSCQARWGWPANLVGTVSHRPTRRLPSEVGMACHFGRDGVSPSIPWAAPTR
jgi:hypothetical protein